ncbi:carbohydrate sulfotransferase [Biomphalaria glabrata]|nr:hypothetical protein BgiMline_006885 [Biomphalaria glabrata]
MVNWSLHILCLYFHLICASTDIYLQTSEKARIDLIDTVSAEYYTCRNRCLAKGAYLLQLHCSCLDICFIYKNCCHDIAIECPSVVKRSLERFGHMVDLQVECLELGNILAIASCPGEANSSMQLFNKDSLVDIIANAPIKDVITGLVYANQDIYNCNVPNGPRNMIKWETRSRVDEHEVSSNKIISKFKHYSFYSPFYSLSYMPNSFDPCISESFQWCNQSERGQCRTRILWMSHERVQCTKSPCRFCRLSRFTLCVDETYLIFADQPAVYISLNHDLLLSATQMPWSKAKCHVSKDVTLSTLDCHFIKCSTYLGYYLHQDGSCRRFNLFYIALPVDDWTLDPEESGDILNYVTYYLTHVLDMKNVSSVEPMLFLHSVQLNQSFSLSTFFLDFQSSAAEDFFLLTYSRELSILASDVKALVALKRGQNEFHNLSLADLDINAFLQKSWKGYNRSLDAKSETYVSCRGRCQATSLHIFKLRCSCMATCFAYKNCCADIDITCPLVVQQGLERYGHLLDIKVECLEMGYFLAIASCPGERNYSRRSVNKDSVYDIIANSPVHDPMTDIVYASLEIYKCNVPNGSTDSLISSPIYSRIKTLQPDDVISRIEHYSFYSPFYSELQLPADPCIYGNPKWCDQAERVRCLNPVTWTSALRLQCRTNACKVCHFNFGTLCVSEPFDLFHGREVLISLNRDVSGPEAIVSGDLVVSAENLPWSEAQCQMSTNVTLSGLACHLVNCSTHLGFYLHQDGSCRKFTIFYVALPGDGWRINRDESGEILDFMAHYLVHELNMESALKVEPLMTLYNLELQQNFSASTFFLDFNSSAPEDFLLLRYSHELSVLASDVRAMVAIKLNQTQQETFNFSMAWQQWSENYTRNTTRPSLPFVQWCPYIQLRNEMTNKNTFLPFNTSENLVIDKGLVCRDDYIRYDGVP